MTGAAVLPLWAELVIGTLVLAGSAIALLGSAGLLRLRSFFERVHAPAMIATAGCWCIVLASALSFWLQGQGTGLHALLIAVFLALTIPVTTIFLMRASLFRARQSGAPVPPSLSAPQGQSAPEKRA